MHCAYCRRPIELKEPWIGNTGLSYCSFFCAAKEIVEMPSPMPIARNETFLASRDIKKFA